MIKKVQSLTTALIFLSELYMFFFQFIKFIIENDCEKEANNFKSQSKISIFEKKEMSLISQRFSNIDYADK